MAGMEQLQDQEDIEARRQEALAWIEQQAQAPLTEVEEIPAHFYEDGLEPLKLSLQLRQLELIEIWKGNKDANLLNIIQKLVQSDLHNLS